VWLGLGERNAADDVPAPNLFKMDHSSMGMDHGSMKHGGVKMDMPMKAEPKPAAAARSDLRVLSYDQLRSPRRTTLRAGRPWRDVTLKLEGDMERYVWTFDGKTLQEEDQILVRRGENVRFTLINTSMMHHPMHLHGHFFRVVNAQGEFSPLKHTVDVAPSQTVVIEFEATEDKDWFFHCHVLYHMMSGMARVVHYEGSEVAPELAAVRDSPMSELNHDPFWIWGEGVALTQMTEGMVVVANTRNTVSAAWQIGWENVDETDYEIDLLYDRYFNRFFSAFAGAQLTEGNDRAVGGVRYLLPMSVESRVWIDSNGEFRFALAKSTPLTRRLGAFGEIEYDTGTEWEWAAGLEWVGGKNWSIVGQYHSDFGAGVGVGLRF
jgi:uncharacterized cupredoxin-like copper-binding protein